jgi:hypothetical protein
MQNEDYKLLKSQDTDVEEAFKIVNQMPPEPPTPPQARVIHEGLGITRPSLKGEEPVDKNTQSEKKAKLWQTVQSCWNTFHKLFFFLLLAMLCGIYTGVKCSELFFKTKVQDSIAVGGMVYKDKIYTIIPK